MQEGRSRRGLESRERGRGGEEGRGKGLMGIRFVLLVNKQGQTRLAQYYAEHLTLDERRALEGEIVRKCLARTDQQVNLPPFPLLLVLPLGCGHLGIESSWI